MKRKTPPYWIDEFISNVKSYIFVREDDNLLIKRPNVATKLNDTGVFILKFLLNGGTYQSLIAKVGQNHAEEVEVFMLAVKRYLEGTLTEFEENKAVQHDSFKGNFSDLPVLSELALTYKCNLKCKFCYAGCNASNEPIAYGAELNKKQYKQVIKKIAQEAKVPSISFTGGEPTIKKDLLLYLISYAKSLGMRVNLISNGTLINHSYARSLKKAGLDSAQISIEGTTPNTHNLLTQKRGSFEKSIASIGFLRFQDIHVHSNTTLNKLNAAESIEMPNFVREVLELDRFSMNLVIPTGSALFNKELVIKYSDVGKIITQIQRESIKNNVEFMWYSPVPMCMFNTITNDLGNKGCSACDGLLSVAPDGNILPCSSYNKSVGSMIEGSFASNWNNKEATFMRNKKFAHEMCQQCEHFDICNGGCPLYWEALGYDELEKIFTQTEIKY